MDYKITFAADWQYRDRKRGPQVMRAGTYRVPEDMKDAVAKMAIEANAAQVVAVAGGQTQESQAEPAPLANRRRPRRKTGAPENKAVSAAENKTTLV